MEGDRETSGRGPLDAAPGLARLLASAGVRTAGFYAGAALRAGRRVTEAALRGESPVGLARDAGGELVEGARRVLGVTDLERRIGAPSAPRQPPGPGEPGSLRRRGGELLERSSSLDSAAGAHPAFDRILTQLAPDEARILALLARDGAQPAVDVRTWRPLGVGSRIVAPGLSMIGRHAGCMHPEQVPAYLANLYRLGLIWFSRDPVQGALSRYQVLEAQPEVLAARGEAGRAQIVRRSIRLTPFGAQFCALCLPPEREPRPSA